MTSSVKIPPVPRQNQFFLSYLPAQLAKTKLNVSTQCWQESDGEARSYAFHGIYIRATFQESHWAVYPMTLEVYFGESIPKKFLEK